MKIDIWEGKPDDETLGREMERIAKLVCEGYREGEVFGTYTAKNGREYNYRGWWTKN